MRTKIISIGLAVTIAILLIVAAAQTTPQRYTADIPEACMHSSVNCTLPPGFRGWPSIP
ncbi:hypothetical protein [Pseudomonas sp. BN411]|uniref:hypothetical protein n=1 Tax=Pseudomonas sp. BN411 TaxID=2567887 RepID=UPI0024558827|nr:hypothetical protein [Pseudomonas sp. BN411]